MEYGFGGFGCLKRERIRAEEKIALTGFQQQKEAEDLINYTITADDEGFGGIS